jgi:hypothetical protein
MEAVLLLQQHIRLLSPCMYFLFNACLPAALLPLPLPLPQGMDGRVMHPSTRKELAYVVALGGEPSSSRTTAQQ